MFRLGSTNFFCNAIPQTAAGGGFEIRFSYGEAVFCNTNQTEILWSYALPIYW